MAVVSSRSRKDNLVTLRWLESALPCYEAIAAVYGTVPAGLEDDETLTFVTAGSVDFQDCFCSGTALCCTRQGIFPHSRGNCRTLWRSWTRPFDRSTESDGVRCDRL